MRLDFRVVVKLLLSAIEPLDESDWTGGPDCEEAISIPVHVEDDSVVVNLIVPQDFVPSAVNKFDLACRCDYDDIFAEIVFVGLGFDRAPCQRLYDSVCSFRVPILEDVQQLELAQVPDAKGAVEADTSQHVSILGTNLALLDLMCVPNLSGVANLPCLGAEDCQLAGRELQEERVTLHWDDIQNSITRHFHHFFVSRLCSVEDSQSANFA